MATPIVQYLPGRLWEATLSPSSSFDMRVSYEIRSAFESGGLCKPGRGTSSGTPLGFDLSRGLEISGFSCVADAVEAVCQKLLIKSILPPTS